MQHFSLTVASIPVELQDFALDWITSNLYVIFRGQRRILACIAISDLANQKCAELFGNQVAVNVGGLALDPNHG